MPSDNWIVHKSDETDLLNKYNTCGRFSARNCYVQQRRGAGSIRPQPRAMSVVLSY